jgi:23S rRNA (cytosine1962-C5)-methyltransferase
MAIYDLPKRYRLGTAEPAQSRVVAPADGSARAFFSDRPDHIADSDAARRGRGRAFWRDRLEQAFALRQRLAIDATAYRLVHGEGDLVPSLVVDRYADYLVIQSLSQGTDRLLPELTSLLVGMTGSPGVLARNDPRVRLLEGLDQNVTVLHGTIPDVVTVREGQIEYDVDLRHGQKTGAFLDQRETGRQRPSSGRADCFSYAGGFVAARRTQEIAALEIRGSNRLPRGTRLEMPSNLQVRRRTSHELRTLERMGETFDAIVRPWRLRRAKR